MGIRTMIGAVLFVGVASLSACNDDSPPTTATIDNSGMTPATLSVIAGDQLDYFNADSRPHKIVSTDCAELSTSDIAAGATVSVRAGQGPKTCHISDQTAPGNAEFNATVDVLPVFKNPSDNG